MKVANQPFQLKLAVSREAFLVTTR